MKNSSTKSKAHQLSNATSDSMFIICLFIIAKYSSILEPIINIFLGKAIDMLSVKNQVLMHLEMI